MSGQEMEVLKRYAVWQNFAKTHEEKAKNIFIAVMNGSCSSCHGCSACGGCHAQLYGSSHTGYSHGGCSGCGGGSGCHGCSGGCGAPSCSS